MSGPQNWNFLGRLRQFDAYPKTMEDFRVKTYGGAAVTIIAAIFMTILFLNELQFYLTKEINSELLVDISRGQKLRINVDVIFQKVSCNFLTVDVMDVSGESQIDVAGGLNKVRLDLNGQILKDPPPEQEGAQADSLAEKLQDKEVLDPNRCESCYGAETADFKCCNTCEDVREAYRRRGWALADPDTVEQCKREGFSKKMAKSVNEGCRLHGTIQVNKVAGNFHIAPGKSFQQSHVHVHDIQSISGMTFNMSHTISHLSFGLDYPGLVNPLDMTQYKCQSASEMIQYFVKIVPTTYVKTNGEILQTNQYSVTKHVKPQAMDSAVGGGNLPGLFFVYELSPMMVKYTESHRSFMHFLTGVCAIIGGVFSVAGLVDSFVYHSARAIQRKTEIGKFS